MQSTNCVSAVHARVEILARKAFFILAKARLIFAEFGASCQRAYSCR